MDIVSIINYKHLTKDTGKLTKKNKKQQDLDMYSL